MPYLTRPAITFRKDETPEVLLDHFTVDGGEWWSLQIGSDDAGVTLRFASLADVATLMTGLSDAVQRRHAAAVPA